jgi:catechol 2,3-dioxygenase-like lactoylglutathione lyase family enzyme
VRVRLEIQPRLEQKPPARARVNAPGRTDRVNARSPAALASRPRRPRKLSHVVLGSPDAAATRRFFVEGIGFRVSDEMPGGIASFLRCSTDHHNLLVQQARSRSCTTPRGRWTTSTRSAAPRRRWSRPIPRATLGLGRHGIGSNYFWYLRDPAARSRSTRATRRDHRGRGVEGRGVVARASARGVGSAGSEELPRARRHRRARARVTA